MNGYFVFIFSVTSFMTVQKQPPEVFYKKVFLKIYQNSQEKKPVPESPFNKVADLRPATLLKRDSDASVLL